MASKSTQAGDKVVTQAIGDSAELVAYLLLQDVMALEGRTINGGGRAFNRRLLLDAYADCLEVAKGGRLAKPQRPADPEAEV